MMEQHPFLTVSESIEQELPAVLEQLGLTCTAPLSLQPPAPSIDADISLVVFQITKENQKDLTETATTIGQKCQEVMPTIIESFSIIKGFVNFTITHQYWINFIQRYYNSNFWKHLPTDELIVIEFSSPNTNKPLHLGHLRNNFLGESVSRILKAAGNDVHKTCIVNDRGIHICKSMLAWQLYGQGETPKNTQKKGDHFVGKYYVIFEQKLKEEVQALFEEVKIHRWDNIKDEKAKEEIEPLLNKLKNTPTQGKEVTKKLMSSLRNYASLMLQARNLLQQWEKGNEDVIALWQQMNAWVYEGFDETYRAIGTSFDSVHYESDCYQAGKNIVEKELKKGNFYQKSDGSIWIDLTKKKLDKKLVRRSDGTSVYITQDIGLVQQRYERYKFNHCIYVVGNEQDYHFCVLKAMLQEMGAPYADSIQHLSYGMVDLPSGKMKSREGTVVDADQLIKDIINLATEATQKLGKTDHTNKVATDKLAHQIGMAAVKFFLLKVHPKKGMLFNPKESIGLHGFTGPFIQYTYARIQSVLSKVTIDIKKYNTTTLQYLSKEERELAVLLESFGARIRMAADNQDPSQIASYAYSIAKKFNTFYAKHTILEADNHYIQALRIQLCYMTQAVLKSALSMLGIEAPNRM